MPQTPTPLLDRLERIRSRRDNPQPPRIVSLYPTPLHKPEWVRRASEHRLYGEHGEIKAGFPSGDAA